MIEIVKYEPAMARQWDELAHEARNGTFLHKRAYMDYHADRFEDCSLVAMDGNRMVTAMPACRVGDALWSHRGLTYGGWLLPHRHFDVTMMCQVMHQAVQWLADHGIHRLVYKPVPSIYHRYPADDDLYALFREGGRLVGCNVATVIDVTHPLAPDRGCRSAINGAVAAGARVEQSLDWADYWQLLEEVLQERHGAQPVHSLAEMLLLAERFPQNIELHVAMLNERIIAGVVTYTSAPVMHCQYIASGSDGRRTRAITLLLHSLVETARRRGLQYLDFGTSNADDGHVLNEGLVQQKSRLGGRSIVYPIVELNIESSHHTSN